MVDTFSETKVVLSLHFLPDNLVELALHIYDLSLPIFSRKGCSVP